MEIRTSVFVRNACVAVSLLVMADVVHAGVVPAGATIVNSGVFVIDSATSSLAYNPGTFSFGTDGSGGPSPTVSYNIGGSFEVDIWTLDGGNSPWLSISHVNLSAVNLPTDIQMPDFINSQLTGTTFSGGGDGCSNIPSGVIASCTSTGSFPTLAGEFHNGAISFKAFIPVGEAAYGGGSTYQINATASVVPIPAAFWLFASVMGLCGFNVWKQNRNVA